MQPLVLQLEADAIDTTVSASQLLRKAKIVATKLDLPEFLEWIDHELSGYEDVSAEDLPLYRKLTCRAQAFNLYHGWQPILHKTAELQKLFSSAPIGQAVGPIEQMLAGTEGDETFEFPYPPEMKLRLVQSLEFPTDVRFEITYGQVWGIIDAVRNVILNWSLELEKSGVLGEGLMFSENEKREAAQVSHHFNIGVVGNVSDQAHVANVQSVHVQQQLDYHKLAELVRQIREAAPLMPEDKQGALVEQAALLDQELAKDNRDPSRVRRVLASIRTVCEGAAGNLVAQGILSMIRSI